MDPSIESPARYSFRVTPTGKNVYCWKQAAGKDYMLEKLKAGFTLFMTIFVLGVVVDVFLRIFAQNAPLSTAVINIFLVIFLFTVLLCFGLSALIASGTVEHYRMTDEDIQTGTGAEFVVFPFGSVEKMTVRRKYIELKKKTGAIRVYVAPEDISFVQSFIRLRIPDDAEIRYEQDRGL